MQARVLPCVFEIAASLLVGLTAALIVTVAGRDVIVWGVEQLTRPSDPVVGKVRSAVSRALLTDRTARLPVPA